MAANTLVLVRHGKAADGAVDAERPLTKRGRNDAAAVGRWLAQHDVTPDRIVVSSAVRAQQTWSAARSELGGGGEVVVDDRIYANDAAILLEIVQETPDHVTTLVLVGHNPSVERFAHALDDGDGDERARRDLDAGYPTCGIALFRTGSSWNALYSATLAGFASPRG